MRVSEFINKFYPAAKKNEEEYKVPALLTLAQAALESGWGEHAPKNNFFGIKAGKSWGGKVQYLKTTEVVGGKTVKVEAPFRAYSSPEECFADHAEVIKKNWSKVLKTDDPRKAVKYLQEKQNKVYATDPAYEPKILRIIEMLEHQLQKKERIINMPKVAAKNEIKVIARGPELKGDSLKVIFSDLELPLVKVPEKPGIEIGTEELDEVIDCGLEFANATINALKDGKVTLGDIPAFIPAVVKVPKAISGLENVPAELENLTEEELKGRIELVKNKLNVDDEKAKAIVEASIKFVYSGYQLVKAIQG